MQQAGESIQHYRDVAEQQRQVELKLATEQLKRGADPEYVMQVMSYRLTNKMLHIPSRLFREAAKADDPSHYEWLNETVHEITQGQRRVK